LGTNTGPQSIFAVDLDRDGDRDLMIADGSAKNVTLLRNRGSGEFAAPESVGISLAATDLNSDGLPDVVVARGDSNKQLSGEFAGSISLFTNQLAPGANRAAIPTGNETVSALDFGITNFSPATNAVNAFDVNGDGFGVADDALRIINFLNAFGSGVPAPIPQPTDNPKLYYDVTGDLFVAPDDALAVINFINSDSNGEGEAPLGPGLPPTLAGSEEELLGLLASDIATRKRTRLS
jgi:hypothetical protein